LACARRSHRRRDRRDRRGAPRGPHLRHGRRSRDPRRDAAGLRRCSPSPMHACTCASVTIRDSLPRVRSVPTRPVAGPPAGRPISAVIANAPDGDAARSAVFWLNGDLSGRTMTDVGIAVAPILLGAAVVIAASRQLDMLDLGDDLARAAGVEVRRTTHIVLAAAALTTAAVSITGIISFVGLVVPHLVRLLTGPRHTLLLPASFLVGGVFLTV